MVFGLFKRKDPIYSMKEEESKKELKNKTFKYKLYVMFNI